MKNGLFKKSMSVFLAMLMLLTCWVWVAPTQAEAVATDTTYRKADKYGTPAYTTANTYYVYFANGNNKLWVYFPTQIHLDVSETLQSAGYKINVKYEMGSNPDYKVLLGGPIWGDYLDASGKPTKYYTMTNIFSDYTVDASIPNGGSSSNVSIDKRGTGDGFTINSQRHETYVKFAATSSGPPNTANIYLMGTPSKDYVGKTEEFNTTTNSVGSYGMGLGTSNKEDKGITKMVNHKWNDGNYKINNAAEMYWTVTIYDKSTLNATINEADNIVNNLSYKYTTASINSLKTALNNNRGVLTTRATTQSNIDTANTNIRNAINGLVRSNTITYDTAGGTIVGSGYTSIFTKNDNLILPEATRTGYTFGGWKVTEADGTLVGEKGKVYRAANHGTGFDGNATLVAQWTEHKYNIAFNANGGSGSTTGINNVLYSADTKLTANAFSKTGYTFTGWNTKADGSGNAYADQVTVSKLSANDGATVTLYAQWTANKYTVTWKNDDGTVLKTDTYNYNSNPSTPANTAAFNDESGHHTFAWPEVSKVTANVTYTEIETVVPHEYNRTVATATYKATDATCTEKATYYYSCTCGAKGTATFESGEPNGHDFDATVKAKDATCTENGNKAYKQCTACSLYFDGDAAETATDGEKDTTSFVLGSTGHNMVAGEVVAPTCTVDGYTVYTCSNGCGTTENRDTVTATGHVYTATVTAPTCTEKGYTTHTCACGDSRVDTYVDATGHTYTYTSTNDGKHTIGCSNADCTYNETADCADADDNCKCDKCGYVDATFHNPGDAATCTTAQTCTVCGAELNPAKGHTEVKIPAVDATCIATGLTAGVKCSVCGVTITAQTVTPMIAHTYGELIKEVPATCKKEGTVAHYSCSYCSKNFDADKVEITDLTISINPDNHNMVKTSDSVAPTCTADGKEAIFTCEYCDHKNGGEVIKSEGHVWSTEYTKVSDSENGEHSRSCTKCGEVEKSAHTWSEGVINPDSTCAEPGTETFTCTAHNCGATYTKEVALKAHTLVSVDKKDATCTEDGHNAYEYCTKCEYSTKVVAPALNHSWTDATCTAPKTCATCGETEGEELGHDYSEYVTSTAGNCQTKKTTTYKCSRCDSTNVEVGELGDHSFTNYTSDGNATCAVDGTKTALCDVCNTEKHTVTDEGSKDAVAHTEATREENRNEATCGADGSYDLVTYCSVCKKVLNTEAKTITATGNHTYEWVIDTEATCGATGLKHEECTVCDATRSESTVIEATGEHTEATREENRNEATCGAPGSYDLVTYCSVCNTVINTEAKTIPATGAHNYATEVEGSRVDSTCNTKGSVTLKCACGATEVQTLDLDTTNHEGYNTEINRVPSTCSTKGSVTTKCACGDTKTTELELDEANHEGYTPVVTAPTCEADGYTTYTCACGDSYTDDEVSATGHDMVETEAAVDPTCTEDGKTAVLTCANNCGKTEGGEVVPSTGHDYEAVVTAPTCEADGYTTYTCACGDTYTDDEVSATGHDMVEKEAAVAPTCTEDGKTAVLTCANNCGKTEGGEVVPSTGHNHEAVVTAPTCEADGYTTYTCSCGDTYTADVVAALDHDWADATCTAPKTCKREGCGKTEGDVLGHNFGEWEVIKAATCTAEGEQRRDCSRCDAFETKVIEKTAHTPVPGEYKAPTCISEGYEGATICDVCKVEITAGKPIDKLAHEFGNTPVQVIPENCTYEATYVYKCKFCTETNKVGGEAKPEGDKGPHTIVELEKIEPTCDTAGIYSYYCSTCGGAVKTETIDPIGHADKDGDGYCDNCGGKYFDPNNQSVCTCLCHKESGFMKFLYKIANFFWKLFKINKSCACGYVHY